MATANSTCRPRRRFDDFTVYHDRAHDCDMFEGTGAALVARGIVRPEDLPGAPGRKPWTWARLERDGRSIEIRRWTKRTFVVYQGFTAAELDFLRGIEELVQQARAIEPADEDVLALARRYLAEVRGGRDGFCLVELVYKTFTSAGSRLEHQALRAVLAAAGEALIEAGR